MGLGSKIETRGHVLGFREEISKVAQQGNDALFSWFNNSVDMCDSFQNGQCDFIDHIWSPISHHIPNPDGLTALEIGYGGGRLLASACKRFKQAIGVDIHDEEAIVAKELNSRGLHNFTLIKGDGKNIPIADSSVDVIYSFIVLQHVEKIETFKSYLREAFRCLNSKGIAILYFGRHAKYSLKRKSRLLYRLDCLIENIALRKGYREYPARVNCTNLRVTYGYVNEFAMSLGYCVIGKTVSRRLNGNGELCYGGQHGIMLRKV